MARPRLFSVKYASNHTSVASRKVSRSWPDRAYVPGVINKFELTPVAGTRSSVHSRFSSASAKAAKARWILIPFVRKPLLGLLQIRFGVFIVRLGLGQLASGIIGFRDGNQPFLLKREDPFGLNAHRIRIALRACQLGLRRTYLGRGRTDLLSGRPKVGLGSVTINLVGSRVDPNQQIAAETTCLFSTNTLITVPVTCGTIWVATALMPCTLPSLKATPIPRVILVSELNMPSFAKEFACGSNCIVV